jgi:uncharacterized protein with ATP-grasp and redox domains
MDMDKPPPLLGQRIHRRIREIVGVNDPYLDVKDRQNRMALDLLPDLRAKIDTAADPLGTAVHLAIVGNLIDMAVNSRVTESDIREAVGRALAAPFAGDTDTFRAAVAASRTVLYLADNAGEIFFDRLLIEKLPPGRVTVAVRGGPIINDATMADARAAGLDEIVEVIDNGSDAPGTILEDCSREFKGRFREADLIIAKGQGNFESLSDEPHDIFFLFTVKCSVIAAHVGVPIGTHLLTRSRERN